MTRLNLRLFWGFWAALILLWLFLNPDIFAVERFFPLRRGMVQFTGVLAMAAMSVAMLLALRPRWPERRLGGLDKMYRLHKWLGIGALGLAICHWFWAQGPKWLVQAGLLAAPERRGRGGESADTVFGFLRGLRGTAEGLGEWAFYAVVALLLIALVKLVTYRPFLWSHRLLPVAYLVLVFHSVVLLDTAMWATALGLLLALMMAAGSYAALASLFGRIGRGRRVAGKIVEMENFAAVHSLRTVVELGPGWPGHKAGQFAFVTSNRCEGAHPYTIASAWDPTAPQVTFVTKELGDHTTGLVDKLRLGQEVTVEGPYGCFTFDDGAPRQIWIGGGIGITPFIARLKELAAAGPDAERPEIDFFHTTREVDEAALARLAGDVEAAKVRLHLLIDARDGRLTAQRIRDAVPAWQQASVWFCGPGGFGRALRHDFAAMGLPVDSRFHQELFEMR